MNNPRLQYLFGKYFNKTASEEEKAELADLIGTENHREQVMQLFAAAWEKYEGEGMVISDEKSEQILESILSVPAPSIPVGDVSEAVAVSTAEDRAAKVRRMSVRMRVVAAVMILPVLIYVWKVGINRKSTIANEKAGKVVSSDVGPGSYKAALTLADGSRITLDSAGPGQLALQGSTKIISRNGGLLYQQGAAKSGPVMYNTLTTGKGQTYSFALADGSKVWLNSASSIRFPVAFPGKERRIAITGEVFIQVSKDPSRTFIVTSGSLDIEALGTAFNVMSYPDEEHISATLVEGMVRLTGGRGRAFLRPGQQAKLDASGNLSAPENVDVEEIIAWKEGNFQFENADIRTILRQFARWYDVEVIYEGAVTNRKFFGLVSRNSSLVNVLEMLKSSDIRFRIEGKKLYVTSL